MVVEEEYVETTVICGGACCHWTLAALTALVWPFQMKTYAIPADDPPDDHL
jgi:hypothetical protein